MYLCWFLWFECRENFQALRILSHFNRQFFRKHLSNHHRLQASRSTKNNKLFHREHGCLRSAFPSGCNSWADDQNSHWFVSLARKWNLGLGSFFCKLFYFASSSSLFVSVQSLVWIAIDRFVAVVFPLKLGLISSKIRTVAIVSTWILAGVFYFPSLITWEVVEFGNSTYCSPVNMKSIFPNKEGDAAYNWLHVTIRFLAPLLVITVLYTAIAISLKRRSKALRNVAQYEQQHSVKKRRQATQMAVIILVLFYICVIPYTLLRFDDVWKPSCAFLRSFYFISILMFFSSSVVNPIICLSFVESYRRGLRNIVCYFCGTSDNKRAKRERVTVKGIRNLAGENCQRSSKDTRSFHETFETAL